MTDILIPLIGIPAWLVMGFITALIFDRVVRKNRYRLNNDDRMLLVVVIVCWPVVATGGAIMLPFLGILTLIERINR